MKNIIYLIFFVFIFNFQYLYGLNIVLHAQVAPVDKIVGSVITTEGNFVKNSSFILIILNTLSFASFSK